MQSRSYFEWEHVVTPFALLKYLRSHCRRHCEPFSYQNALDCRVSRIVSKFFLGWYPRNMQERPLTPISAWFASVPILSFFIYRMLCVSSRQHYYLQQDVEPGDHQETLSPAVFDDVCCGAPQQQEGSVDCCQRVTLAANRHWAVLKRSSVHHKRRGKLKPENWAVESVISDPLSPNSTWFVTSRHDRHVRRVERVDPCCSNMADGE